MTDLFAISRFECNTLPVANAVYLSKIPIECNDLRIKGEWDT